jgi:fatty-acyl-CoA synthase
LNTPARDQLSVEEAERAAACSISWGLLLRRHARLLPAKPAVRFAGQTITYRKLDDRAQAAAGAFAACGVGPGDRVAIIAANTPEIIEALAATIRLGAIAVPVNFRLTADEVGFILSDSGAKLVIADRDRIAVASQAVASARERPEILEIGESYERARDAGGLHLAAVTRATLAAWAAEAPSLIMYTSGTTGRPKGAVLSHLNLFVQSLTQIRNARLLSDDDVYLCASPLFHVAGVAGIAPVLLLGNTLVLVPSTAFDPAEILDTMEAENVTSMFLVPSQWQAVCDQPGIHDRRLRLHTIQWGASPALPTTLRAMADAFPGAANVAGFGQTEMSPTTASLSGELAIEKLGSVGRPVPTVDVRIVDEEMRDVPVGEIGEIVYRGPTTMLGYWRNPGETATANRGGWFHSGDLVRADQDGYLTVVDRKKDMIISGGENIYSAEVEAAISTHPKVRDVAVVAAPHPRWVETPVAVIAPVDLTDPPTYPEILRWAAPRLASYKKPTAVLIVEELPRNATGKVLKAELREWVQGRGGSARPADR